jgi:hypothetical protein
MWLPMDPSARSAAQSDCSVGEIRGQEIRGQTELTLEIRGGWPTFAFFAKVGAKVVRHRVFRFERVTLRLCPTIRDATTARAWKS